MAWVERYRLEPVRDVRNRDEKVKRGDLAAAVGDARTTAADVVSAAGRIVVAQSALAAARASLETLIEAGASPTLLALADRFCARRRRDVDAAIAEHLRADARHTGRLGEVEVARGQLLTARAQREVIERHFARWRETQRKLAERRED